jgi:hypothetical protein
MKVSGLLVLVAVAVAGCGSEASQGSTGADRATASSVAATTSVPPESTLPEASTSIPPESTSLESTSGCSVPSDFGSAPVPEAYALRTDQPESEVPIDSNIKRPLVSPPQAAVDEVVRRFNFADIKVARLGGPPAGAFGPWLYVLATVPSDDGRVMLRPQWEAITIMGDAAELAASGANLGDAIEGWVLDLQTPDCRIVSEQSVHIGPRAAGQVFAATGGQSDIDFAQGVLDKYGLTPVSIDTLDGVSPVLVVTASIADPTAMNGNFTKMRMDLDSTPPRFESVYLRLQTTAGDDLAISGGSARIGSGGVWFQPGMDAVLGIAHGCVMPPETTPETSWTC